MSLNQMGLGFTFSAQDLASGVMKQVAGAFGATEKAADSASKVFLSGVDKMKGIGASISNYANSTKDFLLSASSRAGEFGASMKSVAARLQSTSISMDQAQAMALKLSAAFATTPEAQATALYEAIGAGARNATSAQQLLTASNALARSSNADVSESLAATSELLKAFGLGFEQAGAAADKLYVAQARGAGTISELNETLTHLAPTASAAGASVDDLLAGLAAMGEAGLKGRMAVGGMKAILEAFHSPSADATAEAKRLGIAFDSNALKTKGLAGVLGELSASGKLNAQSLSKLFGSAEAATAAMALMRNNGANLADTMQALKNGTGSAAKAADGMIGAGARFAALKDQALILIGQGVKPLINAMYSIGNAVLSAFLLIPKPVIAVGAAIAMVAAVFAGFLGSTIGVVAGLIAFKVALIPLAIGIALATALAVTLASVFAVLAVVIAPVAVALYGLKIAFDQNLGGIRDTLTGLYSKAKLVYDGLTQLFSDGAFSGAVMTELNAAGNGGLKQFVVDVFMWGSRIKAFFTSIGSGFSGAIAQMGPVFDQLSTAFKRFGAAIQDLFSGKNDPAANAAKFDAFASAGSKLGAIFSEIVEYAAKGITAVVAFASAVIEDFKPFMPLFSQIGDSIGELMTAIGSIFSSFGALTGSTSSATSGFAGFASVIAKVAGGLVQGLATALHVVVAAIEMVASGAQKAIALLEKLHILTPGGTSPGANPTGFNQNALNGPAAPGNAPGSGEGRFSPATSGSPGGRGVPVVVSLPPGQATPAAANGSVNAPAQQAAATGAGGKVDTDAIAGAITNGLAQQQPDNLTVTTPAIMLDGDKLAEAVSTKVKGSGARGFAASPPAG